MSSSENLFVEEPPLKVGSIDHPLLCVDGDRQLVWVHYVCGLTVEDAHAVLAYLGRVPPPRREKEK